MRRQYHLITSLHHALQPPNQKLAQEPFSRFQRHL
jgi:hypothetical protein